MKTAFARGKITNVNANAVGGQTVMLTQRGQRKTVSAYNADGITKWPTMMIVSHADPSSARIAESVRAYADIATAMTSASTTLSNLAKFS